MKLLRKEFIESVTPNFGTVAYSFLICVTYVGETSPEETKTSRAEAASPVTASHLSHTATTGPSTPGGLQTHAWWGSPWQPYPGVPLTRIRSDISCFFLMWKQVWIMHWTALGSHRVTGGTECCWELCPAGTICHLQGDLWPSAREEQLFSLSRRLLFIFLLWLQPLAKEATEPKNTLTIILVEARLGSDAADGADINAVCESTMTSSNVEVLTSAPVSDRQKQPASRCGRLFHWKSVCDSLFVSFPSFLLFRITSL